VSDNVNMGYDAPLQKVTGTRSSFITEKLFMQRSTVVPRTKSVGRRIRISRTRLTVSCFSPFQKDFHGNYLYPSASRDGPSLRQSSFSLHLELSSC